MRSPAEHPLCSISRAHTEYLLLHHLVARKKD